MTFQEAVDSVAATVITEDNLLLRTCEHGVRHPVGRITGFFRESDHAGRHEMAGPRGGAVTAACDGCCIDYPMHARVR